MFVFGAVPATNTTPAAGDFRATAINALTALTGDPARATFLFDQGTKTISDSAAAGVKPYVYAAMGVGALGLVFGTWALIRTRGRS